MVPMRPIGLISDGEVVWREKRSLTAFRDDERRHFGMTMGKEGVFLGVEKNCYYFY